MTFESTLGGMFLELISVIVPVYKVEEYLDQCVKSIVEQTYHNLEIILVDDGSPDECPQKCDEWTKQDKRIRVIHKKNGGLSDARNVGLRMASGTYVSFIDSDDWISPDFYENLYHSIIKNNAQIAASGIIWAYKDHLQNDKFMYNKQVFSSEEALSTLIQGRGFYAVAWNKLYRKTLFEEIEFPVGKLHEDEFVTYRLVGKATKLVLCQKVIYYYRQREGSIMQEWSIKHLDALDAFFQRNAYLAKYYPKLYVGDKVNLLMACVGFFRECSKLSNSQIEKNKIRENSKNIKFTIKELSMLDRKSLINVIKGKVFFAYAYRHYE